MDFKWSKLTLPWMKALGIPTADVESFIHVYGFTLHSHMQKNVRCSRIGRISMHLTVEEYCTNYCPWVASNKGDFSWHRFFVLFCFRYKRRTFASHWLTGSISVVKTYTKKINSFEKGCWEFRGDDEISVKFLIHLETQINNNWHAFMSVHWTWLINFVNNIKLIKFTCKVNFTAFVLT